MSRSQGKRKEFSDETPFPWVRQVFATAFLSPTGITGCSHENLPSLTCLFSAC